MSKRSLFLVSQAEEATAVEREGKITPILRYVRDTHARTDNTPQPRSGGRHHFQFSTQLHRGETRHKDQKKENFYSHLVAPSKKNKPPSPLPPPPPFSVCAFCVWWQTHPSPPPSLLAPQPTSKGAAEGVGVGREPKRCVAVAVAVVSLLGKVTRVIEDATREKKKRRLCFQSTMGSFLQEEGRGQGRGKTRGFSSEKEGGVKSFLFCA